MMVKASIVPLVFIFTLIAGDVNEDSIVTQTPQLQFDHSRDRAFYSCQFNFLVRCVWKHNGNIINIYDYDYTWKMGNGYNTYDCSIEARSKYPRKLSDESTGATVECIGVRIENGPPKVASDPRDSRAIRIPLWQFDQSRNRSFYRCQFNFVVRCLWIVNDAHIDIVKYGYTWMTGNGSNTNDCSIRAESTHRRRLGDDGTGATVECIGIGSGPRKVTIGDSIGLQCPAANRKQCQWTRGTERLPKNSEYSYIGDSGCSIRINPIRKVDLTQWNCYDLTTPQRPRATYTLVEQNLTDPSSKAGESSSKTTTTSITPTITTTETGAISSTISTSTTTTDSIVNISDKVTPNVMTTRKSTPKVETPDKDTTIVETIDKEQTAVYTTQETVKSSSEIEIIRMITTAQSLSNSTVLVATIVVLSIVIIVGGVAWIFRERIKKKNTTHGDSNRHNHDGGVSEVPSSTSNVHHSFGHVKATKCQSETEDGDGYLIANQQSRSENAKSTNAKRLSDPKSHVYETIKDDIYTNVQDPTGNNPTYTVLF